VETFTASRPLVVASFQTVAGACGGYTISKNCGAILDYTLAEVKRSAERTYLAVCTEFVAADAGTGEDFS
jgi:hypothetical protein